MSPGKKIKVCSLYQYSGHKYYIIIANLVPQNYNSEPKNNQLAFVIIFDKNWQKKTLYQSTETDNVSV